MNTVTLIGRLTKEPSLKYTPGSGNAIARFTIAVDRGFTNKDGKKEADFINIEAWNKVAENCANYLVKGSLVGIVGSLRIDNYKDQTGEFKSFTKVLASTVKFLDSKNSNKADVPGAPAGEFQEVNDDDIPF